VVIIACWGQFYKYIDDIVVDGKAKAKFSKLEVATIVKTR